MYEKQSSDSCQTGPGTTIGKGGTLNVPPQKKAGSIGPAGNTTSGSSQSESRGKQG